MNADGARAASGDGATVLHVVAPAEFGGLEQVVRLLAVAQRERGRDASVLAFLDEGQERDHPFVTELRDAGVPIDATCLPHRAYRAERRVLAAAIDRLAPSIVHTHGTRVDVVDPPVARRHGVPAVATVHGFTGGGWKNRVYEWLHRRALRRVDAVVAVSAHLGADLAGAGVPPERLHVVPNAWRRVHPVLSRKDARAALRLDEPAGSVIGWVGRVSNEKGADVLLDALRLLRGEADWCAVVIGEGQERGRLERRARESDLEHRIRWAGALRGAAPLFSAFDVFVLSSRTEGTPIALFEAIDAGVPVVATAVGGVPDVLGSDGGLLVPPENPGALARAMRTVLRDRAAAAKRAATAGHRLRSHYGVDAWFERYERVYASAGGGLVEGSRQ